MRGVGSYPEPPPPPPEPARDRIRGKRSAGVMCGPSRVGAPAHPKPLRSRPQGQNVALPRALDARPEHPLGDDRAQPMLGREATVAQAELARQCGRSEFSPFCGLGGPPNARGPLAWTTAMHLARFVRHAKGFHRGARPKGRPSRPKRAANLSRCAVCSGKVRICVRVSVYLCVYVSVFMFVSVSLCLWCAQAKATPSARSVCPSPTLTAC